MEGMNRVFTKATEIEGEKGLNAPAKHQRGAIGLIQSREGLSSLRGKNERSGWVRKGEGRE